MVSTGENLDNDTASSMIEELCKAVLELEACKDASQKVQWTEIEHHFRNLEMTLKKKSEELEAKEKEYEQKEAETFALIAEREAVVAAKEQDLLDRVQELKDAAVAAIAKACVNFHPTSIETLNAGNNSAKVSSPIGNRNSLDEDFPHKTGVNTENVAADVKPRPELMQFCQQMDAKGLLNFVMENQKNLSAIRQELSIALESASEPARLVLDSLEGFYPPDETTRTMDKRDAALQGMLKSCLFLIEAMDALLARIDPGADHLLNPETKQQAKAIADEWKLKFSRAGSDAANGIPLEAEAFLLLLATFRIASEFDEEELCKLVVIVAHRRQAPELCRSIGLTEKMPGVVELLINSGRQIDAVRLIHAFQLTESFPPVPLLKTYLKDLRRNSQGKGGNVGGAAGAQGDINAQELAALKAVIRCVQECGLEADYPLDPLQKRFAQLEKAKSDNRKRAGDFGKHQQQKKFRPNSGFRGFRGPSGRQAPPIYNDRSAFAGMPERYPHAGPNPYDYQVSNQPSYAPQANDQRLYYYSQDDRCPAPSYNASTSNHGSYSSSGLQPPHQAYM